MKKIKEFIAGLEANSKFGWIVQFVKFGLVGLSNTLISLAIYYFCFYVLRLDYQLSNLIAFIISVTNSYFWNSRYVFKAGEKRTLNQHVAAYIKTFLAYGITYVLSAVLLWVWVDKLGISEAIAPLINLIITIPLNYLMNKFWAFRKKKISAAKAVDEEQTENAAEASAEVQNKNTGEQTPESAGSEKTEDDA